MYIFLGKNIDGKVVHHDEQDGLKDGQAFKPDRGGALGNENSSSPVPPSSAPEKPYHRMSPLPPLELIKLPDHDDDRSSGYEQQREPSPAVPEIRSVAFVDQHEHRRIDEDDENEDVITIFFFTILSCISL